MAVDEKCEPSLRSDLFDLDTRSCQLRRSGIVVELPPQALRILVLLVARPNQLVTRQEIKEVLWPGQSFGDFDSRLNFSIKKLREALGDSAEQPRYVQTVRNSGYMFIAPVRARSHDWRGSPNHDASIALAEPGQWQKGTLSAHGLQFGRTALILALIMVGAFATAIVGLTLKPYRASPDAFDLKAKRAVGDVETGPQISSVSPILPQARQRIVVRGRGFGLHVPYVHTNSPFLAIRNKTQDWAAGRIIPQNSDEVMLDVENWTDNEIVISGFSGDFGAKWWKLVAGDQLEVVVWNPQSGAGPARFPVVVTAVNAR